MAGSGVRISWASTIVGDLSPPTTTQQPPREVRPHKQAHGHVISLPYFQGRFNPAIYLDWELEVEQIFASNNFLEYDKVKSTTRAFIGFASIWWGVYIKKNIIINPQVGNI